MPRPQSPFRNRTLTRLLTTRPELLFSTWSTIKADIVGMNITATLASTLGMSTGTSIWKRARAAEVFRLRVVLIRSRLTPATSAQRGRTTQGIQPHITFSIIVLEAPSTAQGFRLKMFSIVPIGLPTSSRFT